MNIVGRHFMITSVNFSTLTGFCYLHEKKEDKDFIECNEKWMIDGNKFRRIIAQSRRGKKKANGNIKHT